MALRPVSNTTARGRIRVFRVLDIPRKGDVAQGMVVEFMQGDRAFLTASPKFLAYKTRGDRDLSRTESDARLREFYDALLWPSAKEDHDIRLKEDWVYAEVLRPTEFRDVDGYGSLPHAEIHDLFRVFARGSRERLQRKSAQGKAVVIEPGDNLLTGWGRIVRDPFSNIVYAELVSEPKVFPTYSALESHLLAGVSTANLNGYATSLRVKDNKGQWVTTANYFPPRIERGNRVAGAPMDDIRQDLRDLADQGILPENIVLYETTRAFLDATRFFSETSTGTQEFRRLMHYVYGHKLADVSVEAMVSQSKVPGGRTKKKTPVTGMVRMALSRTAFVDRNNPDQTPQAGKIRVLIPFEEGDVVSSAQIYSWRDPAQAITQTIPWSHVPEDGLSSGVGVQTPSASLEMESDEPPMDMMDMGEDVDFTSPLSSLKSS